MKKLIIRSIVVCVALVIAKSYTDTVIYHNVELCDALLSSAEKHFSKTKTITNESMNQFVVNLIEKGDIEGEIRNNIAYNKYDQQILFNFIDWSTQGQATTELMVHSDGVMGVLGSASGAILIDHH